MRYVIVDLEATCWEEITTPVRMEIIEIGSVMLPSSHGPIVSEFQCFVRPVDEPALSEFCIRLTGIKQSQVNAADEFPDVFSAFLTWIGAKPFTLCSWGAYDLRQFRRDCDRHGVSFPGSFERHVNLKRWFAKLESIDECGMKEAIRRLGLSLEGRHHRAIDDARNIAAIAQIILPQVEKRG